MKRFNKYLRVILFISLALIITAFIGVNSFLNKINREDSYDKPVVPSETIKEDYEPSHQKEVKERPDTTTKDEITVRDIVKPGVSTVSEPSIEDTVFKDRDFINIMLIGQDSRSDIDNGRSDAMILATFNKKDNKITLTSFMRDMFVDIPGYKANRLNASYQYGGMKLLDATLEKNFEVKVDGNVVVDFEGFKKAVDEIDGIDIEISDREAQYMGYEKGGIVHMDSRKALIFARLRAIGNSDYSRTERQRRVIIAAYNKVLKMNPVKVIELVNTVLPYVTTDLTNLEIIVLATKILGIDYSEPETMRIPVDGGYKSTNIRGMDVLKPDIEKNKRALQEKLYKS